MAFPAAETPAAATPAPTRADGWWVGLYRRLAGVVEGYPLERIGLAAVAAGVVLRVAAPFFMDFRADGDTYTAMGHAWMRTRTFLMPYGDVTTWGPLDPGYSHHYPPAYPFYLGIVFTLFDFGLWQAKIAAVVVAVAALGAAYWCTRDLYGRLPAALVAGLVALEPHLLWTTGTGFSENMVMLFFTLTMWAILKSLADDRYIVLAGLFAGLAYLTRSSVGYFFIVAGLGGLLWRLTFRGWGVLTNRWYVAAIGVFGSIAATWAWRNFSIFGYENESFTGTQFVAGASAALFLGSVVLALPFLANARLRKPANFLPHFVMLASAAVLGLWLLVAEAFGLGAGTLAERYRPPVWYTSSYVDYVQAYAFNRPQEWIGALRSKIPYFILFLAWWVVPFLPESWRATQRVREEHTSALWLSVFLVWLIAWIISGMFTVFEKVDFISNNHRYVIIGLLPLAWLIVREARFGSASFRLRYVLLVLAMFAACGAVFADPIRYSDLRAAEHLDPHLQPGDEVAIGYGGSIKYAFYPYLSRPEQILIYGCGNVNNQESSDPCQVGQVNATRSADFIVSLDFNPTFHGYTQIGTFRQGFADGGYMTTTLWGRNDVIDSRDIPTGLTFECSVEQLPPCPLKR